MRKDNKWYAKQEVPWQWDEESENVEVRWSVSEDIPSTQTNWAESYSVAKAKSSHPIQTRVYRVPNMQLDYTKEPGSLV